MLDWLANFSVDHQKKKSNSNNSNVISEIKKDPESAENEEWRRKRNSILEPTEIHKTQSAFIEGIIPIIVKFQKFHLNSIILSHIIYRVEIT